jgi:predicted AlkP superfamily pyrophosphatase or phosphodiesterase
MTDRRPLLLTLLLLSGYACCGTPAFAQTKTAFWPSPGAKAQPKVLLIGIDGVRVDVLREVATPNLDALASSGTFSDEARNVRPTVSGPCWSSMLIGVEPEKHGVHNNNFSSNRYGEFPDFLTRIEAVRPELNTFAAVDWLPLGSEEGGGPLISGAVDRKVVVDGYELGWLEADSVSVIATADEIRNEDPDALFVYLGAPDEISHNIGGIGGEYRDAIAAADRHVGRLVDAIKARATFDREDWLVLVSTDHGRTEEGGHGGTSPEETTVFYLASGPGVVVGKPAAPPSIMDVPVTALAHLGIEIDPAWRLDGKPVGLKR